MSAHPRPRLTEEEYLAIERAAIDVRSEFYAGQMYAMSGASHRHGDIASNFLGELRAALRGRGCHVTSSDLRVRIEGGFYTYPDVVVVCGKPEYSDGHLDTLLNPTLLIEVLSPSTERNDRSFKTEQYRKIPSLQEYALVSQTRPHVEVYTRKPEGWLLTEAVGLDGACRFTAIDCTIAMSEIYYLVEFDEEDRPALD